MLDLHGYDDLVVLDFRYHDHFHHMEGSDDMLRAMMTRSGSTVMAMMTRSGSTVMAMMTRSYSTFVVRLDFLHMEGSDDFVSPLEFAPPIYVMTDAGVVSCGGETCGTGDGGL